MEILLTEGRRYSAYFQSDLQFTMCRELSSALDGADAVVSSMAWDFHEPRLILDALVSAQGDCLAPFRAC